MIKIPASDMVETMNNDFKLQPGIYKSDRYDVVYAKNDKCVYLKSYVPHDGYSLFVVGATYASSLAPSKYYVVARNAREARAIFKSCHGDTLNYIKFVKQCDSGHQDFLLNNYIEHPVIVI